MMAMQAVLLDSCVYDEIFDFDFSDVSIVDEDETTQVSSSQSDESPRDPAIRTKVVKRKPNNGAKPTRSTQFMKKVAISSSLGVRKSPVPESGRNFKPNVSKRRPSDILYAFPNYDKSDSLLYFPHAMTRHLNSGDMDALKRLMLSHADRRCQVILNANAPAITARSLLNMSTIMHDLRPDMIILVRNTLVVENEIRACAYWKYTDINSIYASVVRNITDPVMKPMFNSKNSRRARAGLNYGMDPDELQRNVALIDSDADLLFYGAVDITVTFDPITKKIVKLGFVPKTTSLHPLV